MLTSCKVPGGAQIQGSASGIVWEVLMASLGGTEPGAGRPGRHQSFPKFRAAGPESERCFAVFGSAGSKFEEGLQNSSCPYLRAWASGAYFNA
ncbi:hypothetical protein DBR47_10180 [Paucibacter sp. KBW04]|nr:hypothetical protein DBR47_10180 [Paucibacter sp. KBW04]